MCGGSKCARISDEELKAGRTAGAQQAGRTWQDEGGHHGRVHWRRSGMAHLRRLRLDFRRESASCCPDPLLPASGPGADLPGELGPKVAEQGPGAAPTAGAEPLREGPSLLPETSCPTPSTAIATWPGSASG